MQLSQLVDGSEARLVRGPLGVEVTGVSADSRGCTPGTLFAALRGVQADGRRFVGDALARGAVAVLADDEDLDSFDTGAAALLASATARRSFALICAHFFGAQPATAIAVTGTNGKSSVAEFCRQLWAALGHDAATLGTLGVVSGTGNAELGHTTPDPATLHRVLADLAARGLQRVALEASSHGLHQHRLDGVRLRAAGFTNLSQDHFDYHATLADYRDAKGRLFTLVEAGGAAVLNADTPEFEGYARIARDRGLRVISYGRAGADLRLVADRDTAEGGQMLTVEAEGAAHTIALPLPGHFQAMNMLCSAGMVAAVEGLPLARVLALATRLHGVRGRLEPVVGHPAGARVYVDYAHTPDALDTVLAALRPGTMGRLGVVFGCGGDRDRAKRPLMAAAACRHADLVWLTDDNPRTEDPAAIRRQALAGCDRAVEIGDRRQAIRTAVAALAAEDVLVIAGKGHEAGQTVGTAVLPFDDAEEARAAIALLGDRP